MYGRERPLQDELYRLLSDIVKNKRFAGLTLSVQTEFPIDNRRADVVVLKEPENIPILVIETKRKVERRGYYRREERFDPYGRAVIGQALSYAALIKDKYNLPMTPAFATANRDVIVVFSPVGDPGRYLNWEAVETGDYENALDPSAYVSLIHKHFLLDEKNPLREELLQHILDRVAGIWQREVLPEAVRKRPGDWLLGKLRYFVDTLSRYYVTDVLRARLIADANFAAELNALALKAGYKNGLRDIVGEDYSRVETLARMMVYVLMNKIIFYKVLERSYKLDELKPILEQNPNISSKQYLDTLKQYFERAVSVTGDFEQIFITGLYDHIVLSEERGALTEIDELIRLLSEIEIERLGDIIGYIYEDLIPAEERHVMGQFYTPQPIAELIAKWCINGNPDALILGPGCGSGTFEVEAYWILSQLKTGRKRGIPPGEDDHRKILRQIYALDINPFPAQLTAMNLAMKNVRAPTTEANIITADFFSVVPGQKILTPYPIATPPGLKHKEIALPEEGFDVVMGNPPYTRWTEIPNNVQKNIENSLDELLTKYNLRADVQKGREPGLYVYFIMHAHRFLKPGGRLGMIISDSWLQALYGADFGRYLLENFKVKALIDISARVFPVPLIGTCILLLEKPAPGENVEDNKCVFMYLRVPKGGALKVEDVLWAINNPEQAKERYWIKVYRQGDIPKDIRWLDLLFGPSEILEVLKQSPLVKTLSEYFEQSYGNILYLYLTSIGKIRGVRNVGGEEFFYLTEERAKSLGIPREFLYPLLPSSRYLKFFTFTQGDWENLRKEGAECYLFLCHKSRNELPESVKKYIRLGEGPNAQIRLRRRPGEAIGKPVSESLASQTRREHGDVFFDWYDLGGVVEAPIYVARGSQYWVRFVLAKYQCALDDRVLALIPRQGVRFDEVELKALLAYLNSSFAQLQAEVMGRSTGGGMIELDVKPLSDFLILDVKKLPREDVEKLAKLFDELEAESRRLGGADTAENVFGSELAKDLAGREGIEEGVTGLFNTIIKEIDEKVAEILQIEALVEPIRVMVVELARRRLSRTAEARPSALKGSEEQLYRKSGRKGARAKKADTDARTTRLTDFM
jgi:type I restriction-modification system DNA methylase subunit